MIKDCENKYLVGSINSFSMSRLYETQFAYVLIITALRLTAIKSPLDFFSVLLMVTPLRGDL